MCPLLAQPIIAFFSSFLLRPFTVLMKQTRQAVRAVKQSRFLDVYDWPVLPFRASGNSCVSKGDISCTNCSIKTKTFPCHSHQVGPNIDTHGSNLLSNFLIYFLLNPQVHFKYEAHAFS